MSLLLNVRTAEGQQEFIVSTNATDTISSLYSRATVLHPSPFPVVGGKVAGKDLPEMKQFRELGMAFNLTPESTLETLGWRTSPFILWVPELTLFQKGLEVSVGESEKKMSPPVPITNHIVLSPPSENSSTVGAQKVYYTYNAVFRIPGMWHKIPIDQGPDANILSTILSRIEVMYNTHRTDPTQVWTYCDYSVVDNATERGKLKMEHRPIWNWQKLGLWKHFREAQEVNWIESVPKIDEYLSIIPGIVYNINEEAPTLEKLGLAQGDIVDVLCMQSSEIN
eukprot:TRINITY_DN3559_c0_g1_i1.p1 TRINITY_DN3559_c0_g1~~TRINITY_DN3559_c0_g1_i1.p1  ORF type:complete len:281 (-),score=43.62 TRINITY_DN3559_c0_g1_i1:41-883(-)